MKVNPADQKQRYAPDETGIFLDMTVIARDGRRYAAKPGMALKDQHLRYLTDTVASQSLVLRFNKVLDEKAGKLQVGIKESAAITDLITLKVYEFPMINVLWLGVMLMVVGFVMSIVQRVRRAS